MKRILAIAAAAATVGAVAIAAGPISTGGSQGPVTITGTGPVGSSDDTTRPAVQQRLKPGLWLAALTGADDGALLTIAGPGNSHDQLDGPEAEQPDIVLWEAAMADHGDAGAIMVRVPRGGEHRIAVLLPGSGAWTLELVRVAKS